LDGGTCIGAYAMVTLGRRIDVTLRIPDAGEKCRDVIADDIPHVSEHERAAPREIDAVGTKNLCLNSRSHVFDEVQASPVSRHVAVCVLPRRSIRRVALRGSVLFVGRQLLVHSL
jgi:hypothetical protein